MPDPLGRSSCRSKQRGIYLPPPHRATAWLNPPLTCAQSEHSTGADKLGKSTPVRIVVGHRGLMSSGHEILDGDIRKIDEGRHVQQSLSVFLCGWR